MTLRSHRLDDVNAIVEQSSDAESQRWTTLPREYVRTDAVAFVERNLKAWRSADGKRSWAVEWVDDGGTPRFGGTIDLRPMGVPTVGQLGFGLHPQARGRGVMARAIRVVVTYASETGGWGRPLHRVHWRAIVGNWASRRAAWAAGFTFHGTIPESHPDPSDPSHALDMWTGSIGAGDPMMPQTPWFTPTPMASEGIRLRAWRPDDIDAIEPRDDDPAHWMPSRSVLSPDTFER